MMTELRMYLVLVLAGWIIKLAPDTDEGNAWLAAIDSGQTATAEAMRRKLAK